MPLKKLKANYVDVAFEAMHSMSKKVKGDVYGMKPTTLIVGEGAATVVRMHLEAANVEDVHDMKPTTSNVDYVTVSAHVAS